MSETNDVETNPVERIVMPLQPIRNNRFVPNRIVEKLLEVAPIDLNDIAAMDFTNEEHEQLAQLIGYSVSGFQSLSYVSSETYCAVDDVMAGKNTESDARITALRKQVECIREGLRIAVPYAFDIHSDDLKA